MACLRINAHRMLKDAKEEIAAAEAIFRSEDPEAYAEYQRRIGEKDPRGVSVIVVDDMGDETGREELKETLAMTKL